VYNTTKNKNRAKRETNAVTCTAQASHTMPELKPCMTSFEKKVASWQQVPVVFVAQHKKILFPVEAEISVVLYYVPDSEMSSVHFQPLGIFFT
jgi:hypothetical protein